METGVKTVPPISAGSLFDAMVKKDFFIRGRGGTIISIGCFSECWSSSNKSVTVEFIRLSLSLGNPIQFATKREVSPDDFEGFIDGLSWCGQLSVFISCSTISYWRDYEKGTARPSRRYANIESLFLLGIIVFVYIKPVIEGVTELDKTFFLDLVKETNCAVVVGGEFVTTGSSRNLAPIPSESLYLKNNSEQFGLAEYFKENGCSVFERSIDAVNNLRWHCYA